MSSLTSHLVKYCLQFCKNAHDVKTVTFQVRLTICEIDSLAFLFSKYFDQSKYVNVKGLTFFNEFNKCVEYVKQNFDSKQQNNDIKQLFSVFLKHEFMGQVPNFKKIMQFLQKYLKSINTPSVAEIAAECDKCALNKLDCTTCKINYLAASINVFNANIKNGWDIFLRPMFGLPLFLFVIIKTDYDENGVFNADDLMTDSFASFFYNLLSDKSFSFVNQKSVQPLMEDCRRATVGYDAHNLEFLLCMLRNNNTCNTPLFTPFKNFIIQLAIKTKIKQAKINKIAAVVFTGFYLRVYVESAGARLKNVVKSTKRYPFDPIDNGETLTPFELELRNVCRFILPQYNEEQFEKFIFKLANIKRDLSTEQYIVTENHIRRLVNKHNLDEDFAVLLKQHA
ncbi:p45 [Orgyia leucostigma nucleopolyhedrovirus]|uniref:p45 n=1 Tax=Orgyia leucostigma nucleopolyhedrovirus TaxID=490711 RepID=B0FDV8_9ABAC|nr:p45 [Orgyia leucostigma nucleopolyhedrovirus]ABY65816.1 p45 [Orgyia leucostigma nucleopolyhedrovirus]